MTSASLQRPDLLSYEVVFERDNNTRVKSLSFHARLPLLVVSYHSGLVQLFNYHRGTLVSSMEEHEGPVRTVIFHSERDLLASGGDDGLVKLWSTGSSPIASSSGQSRSDSKLRVHVLVRHRQI